MVVRSAGSQAPGHQAMPGAVRAPGPVAGRIVRRKGTDSDGHSAGCSALRFRWARQPPGRGCAGCGWLPCAYRGEL